MQIDIWSLGGISSPFYVKKGCRQFGTYSRKRNFVKSKEKNKAKTI